MIDIQVKVRVVSMANNPRRASRPVKCLVDTGATLTTLPEKVLARAGVSRKGPISITVADGRIIRRFYGHAILQIEDSQGEVSEVATNVIFGEKKEPALLGEVALETAGYTIDTVKGLVKKQYFTQYHFGSNRSVPLNPTTLIRVLRSVATETQNK